MEISHRIHARKVVLSHFYQRYFFLSLQNDTTVIKQSLAIAHTFPDHEDFVQQQEELAQALASYAAIDSDEMIEYLVSYVFDKRKNQVDTKYLLKMFPVFDIYYDAIQPLVDTHATTFSFARMDTIDKSLFLLGYAEYQVFKTPKEIIINELVELAKRYADEGAAKLVNAIMHKVL
jgi:transcription termination factor NusB